MTKSKDLMQRSVAALALTNDVRSNDLFFYSLLKGSRLYFCAYCMHDGIDVHCD